MMNVPEPMGPALPGTKQVVVSFDVRAKSGRNEARSTSTHLMMPFLPCGLLLWGVTGETRVDRIMVGNVLEATGDGIPIPGEYFTQGHSFEQIVAMAECGELDLNIAARQQLQMSVASAGMKLTLMLQGPCERACVWGRTYVSGHPYERASVERSGESYTARLDRVDLRGVDTTLDATAPTEAGAIALLGVLAGRGRHV